MVEEAKDRSDLGPYEKDKMYRGYKSLTDYKEEFQESTLQEIERRLRGSKMYDTGSCSESCEVFTGE
jgi:hypothetical protein